MRIKKKKKSKADFEKEFVEEIAKFIEHSTRIKEQFKAQRTLKQRLQEGLPGHVCIHMDFAEDYRWRCQEEIQSAYWSQTQVTLHASVVYYKKDDKLVHQSCVFESNEPQHDVKFVFALLRKLVLILFQLVPDLKFVHYWTDSPTSQYRNETIFKVVSCHQEYFNVPASWSYMESGHGKGPCDPIGGTAKRKADIPVKNDKAVIQDADDIYNWAKDNESVIKFYFKTFTNYENAANFLTNACENIKPVAGTMKLHAVLQHSPNKVCVRNTSCFNSCCFNDNSFQPQPNNSCQGWRLICLNSKTSDSPQKLSNRDGILPQLNNYVATV